MVCVVCGKIIKDSEVCFNSDLGNTYCEDCGDKYLVYNSELIGFVLDEDDELFYLDDELSDIEVFDETIYKDPNHWG